jgi:flagellar biosynthetic protein FlhB
MGDAADRSLPASPRRREAARRAGMMPAAALPAWAAGAVTALLLLPAWGRATLPAAAEMLRGAIRAGCMPGAGPVDFATVVPAGVVLPTLGLVLASAGAALAVRFLFDGLSWQPGRAAPDLARVDPLAGLRRIFSLGTLGAILGNGLGLGLLVATAAAACGPLAAVVATAAGGDDADRAWAAARSLLLAMAAAAAGIAAGQWGFARLRFERRIRMTPQEFADEAKSVQADPKVRLLQQRRRQAG